MGVFSDRPIRCVVVRMGGIEMQIDHLPYAYFEGDIVPIGEAKISVASQVLQYGTGVFAGIRGYLDQDGSTINIFRLRDHMTRFSQSARLIKIDLGVDVD